MAAGPQPILLPVTIGLIAGTVFAALLANMVPLPPRALELRPDFCALILVYWGIHQPRRVGFWVAFALGIAVDLIDASLLGQHALAYVTLLFGAVVLSRRLLNFGLIGQCLHVLPLLFAAELVMLAVRLLAGDGLPAPLHLVGPVLGAVLWIPLSVLLRLPRMPRANPDRV